MSEPEFKIVKMPMHDTGIGREAGFRDDAHLIEVAKAEREAMDPTVRRCLEDFERQELERFLFG